jgi:hypothetical protein
MPPSATRESALAAVLARRVQHQEKGIVLRAGVAIFASALLVFVIPLLVVLPEVGLPVLLWSLSLLALEFDWAAKAYAWVTWRWQQFHAWFRRRHVAIKTLIIAATLAVAVGLLGLVFLH